MTERPLWAPTAEAIARSHLRLFADQVTRAHDVRAYDGLSLDYGLLHRWSIEHPERFWPEWWRYCGIVADERPGLDPWDDVVIGLDRMAPPDPERGPRWFLGAKMNFAENLLRYRDDREALVSWNESGRRGSLTYAELQDAVANVADALRAHGIVAGDRVAGFVPNIPEAIIAMLATASLGAIWSSCSPDFGVKGVLDRFGQIAPRVLFTADGYRYAGKEIDSLGRVKEIVEQIPAIEHVVVIPYLRNDPPLSSIRNAATWAEWAVPIHDSRFTIHEKFAFDHPLYIMYSSGTTGLPKCMVHGAGGTLLQHMKEHQLHADLRRDDRLFYFSTCGWMMWNWLASGLATGATLILYDGAPLAPNATILWDMAEAERITVFGTSAKYIAAADKAGLEPAKTHDLRHLRTILSTGSPLAPPGFDYVYEKIKRDVCLSSISGGTDIISCFAGGNPAGPVWRGELQALSLGMDVDVFDEDGHPVRGEPGELVCKRPFPSMPVAFWNDPDGAKYRAAYFDHYPGVWRHGDWAEITDHGGMIITGRSDATLNPGGVRIGTAEIYRQVEQLPEVVESLVIGQEIVDANERDVRIVLFVRLRDDLTLDDALRERIRRLIRENASPHHVPKVIVQVSDIPRTISGKITEMAVRDVVHGRPVKNTDALANPQALELYRNIPELALGVR
ncbi:MAG TPA: acetoacetate--CoA ligase [Gemmatimonadaceae bacterium]